MNRVFSTVLSVLGLSLLISLCLPLPSAAADNDTGKMVVGVAPVKLSPALEKFLAKKGRLNSGKRVIQSMDGQLIDRLHNTRKFKVIARSDLDALLKEDDFNGSDFAIKGLDYLVQPSVDNYLDSVETLQGEGGQALARRRRIQLSAVTKIYDTNSGALKESANQQLEKVIANRSNPRQSRTMDRTNQLLVQTSRAMAEKVARKVMDVIYPAKIVAKFNKQVMINRGKGTGITKGDIWTVFAQQGPVVKDPDTGEILSEGMQVPVGKVQVTEVTPKFSRAKITEDRGIAKLQILRMESDQSKTKDGQQAARQ